MHNGFLTMDAEKMSKSLGNVVLITELLERFPGEVLRYALLCAHYRAPLDWTDALVDQARSEPRPAVPVLHDAAASCSSRRCSAWMRPSGCSRCWTRLTMI
jgi:cysteinyl-tRNA synthetase